MRLRLVHPAYAALAFAVVSTLVSFSSALSDLYDNWNTHPEYSYGIIIPALCAFLLWRQRKQMRGVPLTGSWYALILVVVGLALRMLGSFSTMTTIVRYGFLLVVYGLVLSLTGPKLFRRLWTPLAVLIFMIPLPMFLTDGLTLDLQLLSSAIGVAVIRAAGISVFLQGNVIDLGTLQLEVAEACSGLRYLFPLMTLAFLVAYLFRGSLWKRAVIFLSSIPIAVLMNSLRIGGIGITVEYWGPKMAEGALHEFEGWAVFMLSTATVILVAFLLARIGRGRAAWQEAFQSLAGPAGVAAAAAGAGTAGTAGTAGRGLRIPRSFVVATAVVTAAAIAGFALPQRTQITPARQSFIDFPLHLGGWSGRRGSLDAVYLDALKLDDYLVVDYRSAESASAVNLYAAYYASQEATRRIHSPRNCIPGGGWAIDEMSTRLLSVPGTDRELPVNRALISLGDQKQLVYYWFQERGRLITSENMMKWYLFWDSLVRNRTDGALVRLVVPLPAGTDPAAADATLQRFAAVIEPQLRRFIPE